MINVRSVYIMFMIWLLMALMYTGQRIFALLLVFQVVLLVLSGGHLFYTLHALCIEQTLSSVEGVKGERGRLYITLKNSGPFPLSNVRAEFSLPDSLEGDEPHVLEGVIPGHGRLSVQASFRCLFRGEFNPGVIAVSFSDMFGIFTLCPDPSRISAYSRLTLTVRPRVLLIGAGARVAVLTRGRMDAANVSAQDASSVRDIRAYRSGDMLKWVHFKLSARRRAVLVREFEGNARPATLLIVDLSLSRPSGIGAIMLEDAVVEAATALAYRLLGERSPVRLIAYGAKRYEERGEEPRDFSRMYAFLTLARFDGEYKLKDVLALEAKGTGQHILVVTSLINSAASAQLVALSSEGNDVAVALIVTEDEKEEGAERAARQLRRGGVKCVVLTPDDRIDKVWEA